MTRYLWLFLVWASLNDFDFVISHGEPERREDIPDVFYWLKMEFVLFDFCIKPSFL